MEIIKLMAHQPFFRHSVVSLAAIAALTIPNLASPAAAQQPSQLRSAPIKLSLNFKVPKRGAPTITAGGASRSFCLAGRTPLTILTPNTNLGLTTSARPSFFVYVPKTAAKSAEFVLKDSSDEDIYRATVPLSGTPGVISLRLPDTAPALQVNKSYRWFFSMVCRPGDRLEDVFVGAWVQRSQPDAALARAIKRATPKELPAIYAEAGYWYDTLTTLADLRRNNPKDQTLAQDWQKLLQSVGLNQVSNAPLGSQSLLLSNSQK